MKKFLLLVLIVMFFISPKIFCQNDHKLTNIDNFTLQIDVNPSFLGSCKITVVKNDKTGYIIIDIEDFHKETKTSDYLSDKKNLIESDFQNFFSVIDTTSLIQMKSNSRIGFDGVYIRVKFTKESKNNEFEFWSPEKDTKEHKIIEGILGFTTQKFTTKKYQEYFELLEQYFDFGLPCKIISKEPYEIRIYGTLSIGEKEDLYIFFNELPSDKAILVDMTNFEIMGTVLYPLFRDLIERNKKIIWVIRDKRQLKEIGINNSKIVSTIELGRKEIKKMNINTNK